MTTPRSPNDALHSLRPELLPAPPLQQRPELALLLGYARVGAELAASRALQRRVDTKFLFGRRKLHAVLSDLSSSFELLAPPRAPWGAYASLYFDTRDLMLFHDHRRGRRRRFKVRLRHYHDRALTFLEVKRTQRPGHTDKLRRQVDYGTAQIDGAARRFVDEAIAPSRVALEPTLLVEYRRITLIGRAAVERVTFDLDLRVCWQGEVCSFGEAVIAEVKQPRFCTSSLAMQALRARGAGQARASKYCLGIMALNHGVRAHRLKPRLRALQEVIDG
ncbi:MAG: VTC domain-containing protein [Proteobacteria bacterium]|nr:VTC domain-containing protein [Pseudomonadota bacterium]